VRPRVSVEIVMTMVDLHVKFSKLGYVKSNCKRTAQVFHLF